MVFNTSIGMVGVVIGLALWMSVLSALLIRTISHYNRLTKGITKRGLQEILEAVVSELGVIKRRTSDVERIVQTLVVQGETHYQRIGVIRFNPFADTGGAQSFTIALLDAKNNGIVMTSLYGRSGNRWYVKEVAQGKGKDVEVSREEQAAIEKAKKSL